MYSKPRTTKEVTFTNKINLYNPNNPKKSKSNLRGDPNAQNYKSILKKKSTHPKRFPLDRVISQRLRLPEPNNFQLTSNTKKTSIKYNVPLPKNNTPERIVTLPLLLNDTPERIVALPLPKNNTPERIVTLPLLQNDTPERIVSLPLLLNDTPERIVTLPLLPESLNSKLKGLIIKELFKPDQNISYYQNNPLNKSSMLANVSQVLPTKNRLFVGSGTIGNVFSPPIPCSNENTLYQTKNYVGKLFENNIFSTKEIKEHNSLKKFDPYKLFTIQMIKGCNISLNEKNMNKFKTLTKLFPNSVNYRKYRKPYKYQIILPFGGELFSFYITKQLSELNGRLIIYERLKTNEKIIELDKNKLLKQFLIPMIDLSYWIGQMNSHKYFHFDIKNDNIIYRPDTQNLYLIDFNISSNSICKLLENIYYYYVNSIINDEPIELRFYGVFSPEVNELSFIFYSMLKQNGFNVISGDAPINEINRYIDPFANLYFSNLFDMKSNYKQESVIQTPALIEIRNQLYIVLNKFFIENQKIQNLRKTLLSKKKLNNILGSILLYTDPFKYFSDLFIEICNVYENIYFIPISRKNIAKQEKRNNIIPIKINIVMVQDSWSYGLTLFYWLHFMNERFKHFIEYSIILKNTINYLICMDYTKRLPLNNFHYLNLSVLSKYGNIDFLNDYKEFIKKKFIKQEVKTNYSDAAKQMKNIRKWLNKPSARNEQNISFYKSNKQLLPPKI
jgi:hypothetical protein